MSLRLAVDIGNTKTKIAVFKDKHLNHHDQIENLTVPRLRKLIKEYGASYVMISSVKHLSKYMQTFIDDHESCFLLSTKMRLPFLLEYQTPQTLGLDRLAGVAGAWSLFPRQNSLVIDAGTCIKYDLIAQDAVYKGGNIAPGIYMRLHAMHLLTHKLPQVAPYKRYLAMGTDTTSALQVGACTGALHEAEGFIREYKKTFGKLNILLTGGDALFFVNNLKTKIFAAPHLVLQGLNEILDYYVHKSV